MYAAVTDTLGPVFAKEAVEIARRKRFYVNRCLCGLVMLAIVLGFAAEYDGRLSTNDAQSRRVMARAASELFIAASVIQFAAVFALVPLFTCAVIAGERETHTLELLFTTTLRDRQIVVSKLASRVVTMAMLVLSMLPVHSIAMFLGGVDPEAVWRSMAVTLLATLFVGAHGIYFSTVTRSPLGALVRTYWWLGLGLVAVPGALSLIASHLPAWFGLTMDVIVGTLAMINPIVLFAVSIGETMQARLTSAFGEWIVAYGFVLPTAWSAFLIYRSVRLLRREPATFGLFAWVRTLVARVVRIRAVAMLWSRLCTLAARATAIRPIRFAGVVRGSIAASNPLWVRAKRTAVYDRDGHIRRVQIGGWALAAFFFFFLLIFEPRGLRDEEVSIGFGAFAWAGVALLAVLLAGASLVGDRKRGWLDLVLVTPLTGREIIDGTLFAVWEHIRRIYWLPIVLALVFCLTTASHLHGAVASVITATLFLALIVLYGVAFSLSARSLTAGLAAAFAFPIAVNVGTAILIGVFEDAHAVVLWVLTVGLFAVGKWWTRRRAHCGAVFCYLLGTHLLLASLATGWTTDFHRDQYPAAAMHAGFLTAVMLDDSFEREFRPWSAFAILPCYWLALVVNIVLTRRWLIRHFDRLAGRSELLAHNPTSSA